MKSMTGYGRGEFAQRGFKIAIELSSVNRKQSEIVLNLPRDLEGLESRVRDDVNRKIARGRLTIKAILESGDRDSSGRVQVDIALAKAYAKELRKLASDLKMSSGPTIDSLLRAPGVLRTDSTMCDVDAFWPAETL